MTHYQLDLIIFKPTVLRPLTNDMAQRVRSTVPKLSIYSSHNELKYDELNALTSKLEILWY